MSTKDLLTQAIVVAGEEVKPQLGTLQQVVEEIEELDPGLRSQEEEEILKVAKATRKNLPLINIATAVKVGGADERHLPRLAVAPYSGSLGRQALSVHVGYFGEVGFSCQVNPWWNLNLPVQTLPPITGFERSARMFWNNEPRAMHSIPLVPTILRRKKEEGIVLLFEATNWQRLILSPGDPFLLKHIAGHIYAVLGTWDITQRELKAYRTARDLGIG